LVIIVSNTEAHTNGTDTKSSMFPLQMADLQKSNCSAIYCWNIEPATRVRDPENAVRRLLDDPWSRCICDGGLSDPWVIWHRTVGR